jgi:Domain of unknown function (DUF4170)
MPKQYWVIGGEYHDAEFHDFNHETSRIFGPYRDFDEATQVWRQRSEISRSKAYVRYSIVTTANSKQERAQAFA